MSLQEVDQSVPTSRHSNAKAFVRCLQDVAYVSFLILELLHDEIYTRLSLQYSLFELCSYEIFDGINSMFTTQLGT